MKARMFTVFTLVVGLALVLTWAVAAQGSEPPIAPQPGEPPPQPTPAWDWGNETPFRGLVAPADVGAWAMSHSVPLGQPGLSFRYVRTFGETEVAYFEDSSHLNYPWGIGTDGSHVWVAEMWGRRALKFTNASAFVMQIGKAGFEYPLNLDMARLADVAADNSGNVWLVDAGAHHILQFDPGGAFLSELGRPWDCGQGNDRFCNPSGIAFDSSGNIYVSDQNNARIQIFDSDQNFVATLGETGVPGPGNDHFDGSEHIAIYQNLLYVADSTNHRVQIFDVSIPSSPSYMATIGVTSQQGDDNDHLNSPTGVAVDASYIYVADSCNNRIQVFDQLSRAYVATIGTGWGSGDYQLSCPTDVSVDSAGNVYVADLNNMRIQQFSNSWAYVRTYGTTGVPYLTDGYHYNEPHGIAVDTLGNTFITEWRGYRLVKLDKAGVFQWAAGEAGMWGEDDDHFGRWMGDGPIAVAADGSGGAYVADTSNHRVVKCSSTGQCGTFAGVPGEAGSDNTHFNSPFGVAVDTGGNVYVGDRENHRIQKCTPTGSCSTFAGVTGEPGSDINHLNGPAGVTVDTSGNVYVADGWNHRVQKFDRNGVWQMRLGTTEECGGDFAHFCEPRDVAIDTSGRIYVADSYNNRVQVLDANGAYLTTIDGSWGTNTGQVRYLPGVEVDSRGNVYVVDDSNHRIQKFAPGVPGWVQSNINGFGDLRNSLITTLASFDEQLYAGTYNWSGNGTQLWRLDNVGWTAVITDGFGNSDNVGLDHLIEFNGQLYASTWNEVDGGEVWRSSDGLNWTRVARQGFGVSSNGEVFRFAIFNDALYASTLSYADDRGAEIWHSNTGIAGDWTRVVTNGFGDANNVGILSIELFNGYLYAGTYNGTTGGEVWRSNDGTTWSQVNADGFGTANYGRVSALATFNGYLYASTTGKSAVTGASVWRCQVCDGSDWQKVVDNGFGNVNTRGSSALDVFDGRLYFVVGNSTTGLEAWRTTDGTNWQQVGFAGFGDSNNYAPYWDNSVTVFNDRLYIGTCNSANGGEVWKKSIVTAGFTASPTEGVPPLAVTFTNTSSGDYTSSLWGFGDGITSTLTSPTHIYTAAGAYTVTLTVSDGIDTSTITRPNYITVRYSVYLPLILRNY